MSLHQEYWNKLGNALTNFQFIEESIRMYLHFSYRIVSRKLENRTPFNFSYKDVRKESLGTLLEKFEKFNSNTRLIKKIRSLTKERNFIAHRAYLMTSEEQKDDKYLSKQIKKIEEIIDKSNKCFYELNKETEKVSDIFESIKTRGGEP